MPDRVALWKRLLVLSVIEIDYRLLILWARYQQDAELNRKFDCLHALYLQSTEDTRVLPEWKFSNTLDEVPEGALFLRMPQLLRRQLNHLPVHPDKHVPDVTIGIARELLNDQVVGEDSVLVFFRKPR